MAPSTSATLITIPISHYCENARWALQRAGIPFRERRHMQVLHWAAVKRAGGGRTVPVFVSDGVVLSESADILDYADAHGPPELGLFGDDPAEASLTRELCRDFDEHLGPDGRLWMYDQLRGQRGVVNTYAPAGVPGWQRFALRTAYPAMSRVIDRHLGITPDSAVAALET